MNSAERCKPVRLEILTATMRLDWAIAQAKSNPTSPALTKFIQDSRLECRKLKEKLGRLERQAKIDKLSKAIRISN
jgi:hypothetical protein